MILGWWIIGNMNNNYVKILKAHAIVKSLLAVRIRMAI